MINDEKGEINAVIGSVVSELLISNDIVSRELLISSLYEKCRRTNDEAMRLRLHEIIRQLLNTMH